MAGELAPISERTVERRTRAGTNIDFFYKIQGPFGSLWRCMDNDCALLKFRDKNTVIRGKIGILGKTIGTVSFHYDGRRKHDKCKWKFSECWGKGWPYNIEEGYCNSLEEGMKIIESLFLKKYTKVPDISLKKDNLA